jgi:hypothetical protein
MAAAVAEETTSATALRPFTVHVPEEALEDMRARMAATRWPEKDTVDDPSQGVDLETIQAMRIGSHPGSVGLPENP